MSDELILLGDVTKTQGLRGEFRVRPASLESENMATLDRIFIGHDAQTATEYKILRTQNRPAFFIYLVENITTIEQAQKLVGQQVFAVLDDMQQLDEGEFYWYELVGCTVIEENGRELGQVESIIPTGANDVLQVNHGRREILIPYISDVILDVNIDEKRITVRLLPGMK